MNESISDHPCKEGYEHYLYNQSSYVKEQEKHPLPKKRKKKRKVDEEEITSGVEEQHPGFRSVND
jgi:hypothetical protein